MTIPEYLASGEPARLVPVTADSNKELRAASILLATLANVPPFAREMMGSIGERMGVRSNLDCFTEVVFKGDQDQSKYRPDGLIVLESGKNRTWRCLVEAKIGRAELDSDQIERYLAIAKAQKIDAVLTISNQFVALPSHTPVAVSKVALRSVNLFHWSWMYVLTQAMLLLTDDEFERPEQRYILAEMVRYFSHQSVGVSTFDRMNPEWKSLNLQIQSGARLSKTASDVENTVAAWHQEVRDVCLLLTRKVGRSVSIRMSKSHSDDPAQRVRDDSAKLVESHELSCSLNVPDAASPITVSVDLQRRSVSVSMAIGAPKDKQRASSRINWVLRQVSKSDPNCIFVKAIWPGRTSFTQATLRELRENPALLETDNKSLSPTQFELLLIKDLAGKFSGPRTFIEQLEEAVPSFYEQVGQFLRAYVAPPPRVRREAKPYEADEALQEVSDDAEVASSDATDETQSAL